MTADPQSYNFELDENSSGIDDSLFLEAEFNKVVQSEEGDSKPGADPSVIPENAEVQHFNSNNESLQGELKSCVETEAIEDSKPGVDPSVIPENAEVQHFDSNNESPQGEPESWVETEAIEDSKPEVDPSVIPENAEVQHFDSNDESPQGELESCVETEAIEDSKPGADPSVIPENAEVQHFDSNNKSPQAEPEPCVETEAIEDSKPTTTPSMKPKIIKIEKVKYDAVRTLNLADTTYSIEGLSSIVDQLEQDSCLLDSLVDETPTPSLPDIEMFGSVKSSQNSNYQNDLESPGSSFNILDPPPMNSTALEPTIIESSTANNTEDASDDDWLGKDYEVEESDTTDNETGSVPDQESDELLTLTFRVEGRIVSAPDDVDVRVANSSTSSDSKKNFCFYCYKLQTKIARHLELVHANEADVKKFVDLPKRNRERQQIIAILRKKGNHMSNTDRRFNDGTLLVCRRPNERMHKNAQDFLPCTNCKGQYARSVIRHHFRKCTKRDSKVDRIVMVKGRVVMARIHEKAHEDVLWKVFSYLREDDVVRAIRYDEPIILFANKQCEAYITYQHLYQMIRARLRLLGRFLIAIKNVNTSVTDFALIYKPACYDSCLAAVKDVAIFDRTTRKFTHPAVASNVGTLLKHVGELLRSKYIKSEEVDKQKQVGDFLKLLSEDYGTSINKAVAETQAQNDRRKKVQLPSKDDIKKLQDYLQTLRKKYYEILKNRFCRTAWHKFAEANLVSLQMFNRRRAGEIERLHIEDFDCHEGIDAFADKDIYNSLSKEAQRLAKNYVRFMIRGKRGRGVPVLVPRHLLQCMNMIKTFRHEAQVQDNNPYFFGVKSNDPDRHKYLSACDLLRRYSADCAAKVPNSLRGTKLRKHIATQCINLNLSETQVSDLANFMGHHEKIHKNIYRQPIIERDITKISKLFELAQGGTGESEIDGVSESESEEQYIENHQYEESIQPSENDFDYSEDVSSPKIITTGRKRKAKSIAGGSKTKRRVADNGPMPRRSWSGAEKCAVLKAFQKYLEGTKLPSLSQIKDVISKNKCLQGRRAPQVKTWIYNERKKMSL